MKNKFWYGLKSESAIYPGLKRLQLIIGILSLCAYSANSQEKRLQIFQPLGRNTGTPCAIDTSNIQIYYAFCASDIRNEDTYRDLFSFIAVR